MSFLSPKPLFLLHHDRFSHCPLPYFTIIVFIYKPSQAFLYPLCLSSVHCPLIFLCHLLSLPLFFFYLYPFNDLPWPRLYSPHLSLSFPSFSSPLLFASPPSQFFVFPLYRGSCRTHRGRGGKDEHELPQKNQHANNSFGTQADLPQQPTALLSLTSLSNHLHIFPSFVFLLSVLWQRLFGWMGSNKGLRESVFCYRKNRTRKHLRL